MDGQRPAADAPSADADAATDDDVRWLFALISDTGMRLSEAAGLARYRGSIIINYPFAYFLGGN